MADGGFQSTDTFTITKYNCFRDKFQKNSFPHDVNYTTPTRLNNINRANSACEYNLTTTEYHQLYVELCIWFQKHRWRHNIDTIDLMKYFNFLPTKCLYRSSKKLNDLPYESSDTMSNVNFIHYNINNVLSYFTLKGYFQLWFSNISQFPITSNDTMMDSSVPLKQFNDIKMLCNNNLLLDCNDSKSYLLEQNTTLNSINYSMAGNNKTAVNERSNFHQLKLNNVKSESVIYRWMNIIETPKSSTNWPSVKPRTSYMLSDFFKIIRTLLPLLILLNMLPLYYAGK